MQNLLRVDIPDTLDYLLKQHFCCVFIELLPFAHKIEQVAAGTEFHDEHDVAAGLEGFVELDNRLVTKFEQEVDLVHYLVALLLFRQVLFIN